MGLDTGDTADRREAIRHLQKTIATIEQAIETLQEQKAQAEAAIDFLHYGKCRQTNILED
jgi:hypothetical protein